MPLIPLAPETRTACKRVLDGVMALCGVATLASLVAIVGWPLSPEVREWIERGTRWVLAAFVAEEALRIVVQERPVAFLRTRWLELSLAVLVASELGGRGPVLRWLGTLLPDVQARTLTLFYLGGTQLTVLGSVFLRTLRHHRLLGGRTLTPGAAFMGSFVALIVAGTLLLKTPQATLLPLSWVDALFLSTSAVCVTGLSPVDISQTLSPQGTFILMGLIQIGGLGVVTFTYFFAHFMAGGTSMRTRLQLRDLLSEERMGQIGTVLGVVVSSTLALEALGAFAIHHSLRGAGLPAGELAFFSVFHAVSAFCNAGFSTLSAGLADPRLALHGPFLVAIMALITLGGIGFPVLQNLGQVALCRLRRLWNRRHVARVRLTTNTRVVLLASLALTFGGAVLFWLVQPVPPGGNAGDAWLTALFCSVTARTAGFNTIPMEALLPASVVVMLFLMYVGGSPASTAGGVKTTTVAVALLALRRMLHGRADLEFAGRRIEADLTTRALTILLLSLTWCAVMTGTLAALHPQLSLVDLVFETVSAISTVGLSRSVTPQLSDAGKLLVSLTMLVGRVGVLTCVLAFARQETRQPYRLPESNLIVG